MDFEFLGRRFYVFNGDLAVTVFGDDNSIERGVAQFSDTKAAADICLRFFHGRHPLLQNAYQSAFYGASRFIDD